ncbi:MAG: tetratricopeptide repeat protein, partial [Xanthomonadales bacterium]|nr:tetratricopeptide repeat protein [Xanthomonadales bacterium]
MRDIDSQTVVTSGSFGSQVLAARRQAQISQGELARLAGCSVLLLRMLEREEVIPEPKLAERIAEKLGLPPPRPVSTLTSMTGAYGFEDPAAPGEALVSVGSERRGYRFEQLLGEGGFGAVYRARQESVGREVAVKLILPEHANKAEFVRRFEAEARMVAALEHPHIVPLYDYWREPNGAFLVMRFLRGGSLHERLAQQPLSLQELLPVLRQLGDAMNAAHRGGVVHRDIKPANLLLDGDGNAYLADFGVAKSALIEESGDQVFASVPYASPELLSGKEPVPATDIYAFGITIFELVAGHRPFRAQTHQALVELQMFAPLPPLSAYVPGIPPEVDRVLARACAKRVEERYRDVRLFVEDLARAAQSARVAAPQAGLSADAATVAATASADAATQAFVPLVQAPATTQPLGIDDRDNPYLGLRAFSEADADNFFGRDSLIRRLLERMGESHDLSRFLAVIGASGSGKSSVVRAGVWPKLRRDGLPGSKHWFFVDLMPGTDPFQSLEEALLRVAVKPPRDLGGLLRSSPQGLLKAAERILPSDSGVELCMLIDQFEEVFTQVGDEAERQRFLDALACAVLDSKSRLRVIITLRADFIEPAIAHADLGELLQQRGEYVLPFTPDELEQAISGPARRVGMVLDTGLADSIIGEVADQPGALPLMQFALSELFARREGLALKSSAYQAIGGVRGALTQRADEVYRALDPAAQKQSRQLMLRLVTLGEGAEDTRRRESRVHLLALAGESRPAMEAALEAFGRSRLLNFDRDPFTRTPTVDVAHEALIRSWTRLRSWLAEARDELRAGQRLQAAALEWQAAKRDASFLISGSKLEQLTLLQHSENLVLAPLEREYLDAALAARDAAALAEEERRQEELKRVKALAEEQRRAREAAEGLAAAQKRSAQRLKQFLVAVGGLLAVAVVLGAVTWQQKQALAVTTERANREAQTATRVSGFLGEILRQADPNEAKGQEVTVRQVLDKSLPRVGEELADQPLVQARLLNLMGRSYRQIGALDAAVTALEQSSTKIAEAPDASVTERSEIDLEYARALADLGRNDEALQLLEAMVGRLRAAQVGGAPLATPLSIIGSIHNDLGQFLVAEPYVREAMQIREQVLPDSPELAITYNNLGFILQQTGRPDQALPIYERAHAIRLKTLGAEHIETAIAEMNIGVSLRELGRFAEAEPRLSAALATLTTLTGKVHPVRAFALVHLGTLARLGGDPAQARERLDEALAVQREIFGAEHVILARGLVERGQIELAAGDLAAARSALEGALALRIKANGEQHLSVAGPRLYLAAVERREGRNAEARAQASAAAALLAG